MEYLLPAWRIMRGHITFVVEATAEGGGGSNDFLPFTSCFILFCTVYSQKNVRCPSSAGTPLKLRVLYFRNPQVGNLGSTSGRRLAGPLPPTPPTASSLVQYVICGPGPVVKYSPAGKLCLWQLRLPHVVSRRQRRRLWRSRMLPSKNNVAVVFHPRVLDFFFFACLK